MYLKRKISILVLLTGLLGVCCSFGVAYIFVEKSITRHNVDMVTAIRSVKQEQVQDYLEKVKKETSVVAKNYTTIRAARALSNAFLTIKESPEMQSSFGKGNHVAPLKRALASFQYKQSENLFSKRGVKKTKNSAIHLYEDIYRKYDEQFRIFIEDFGFENIMIVDSESAEIVYSAKKISELGLDLDGKDSASCHLCRAYIEATNSKDHYAKLIDLGFISGTNRMPVLLSSAPVIENDQIQAIMIVQISVDKLNRILTGNNNWSKEGLGKSGETYIVGSDYKMRSNSRFMFKPAENFALTTDSSEGIIKSKLSITEKRKKILSRPTKRRNITSILSQSVQTNAVESALKGGSGTEFINGYREGEVLSSYAPLEISDLNWVIVAEINSAEVFAPLNHLENITLMSVIILSTLLLMLAAYFSREITRPLAKLSFAVEQLGEGDFSQKLDVTSKDEIGQLTAYFNKTTAELKSMTASVDKLSNHSASLEKEMEEVVKLSRYDFLTGALNRSAMNEELEKICESPDNQGCYSLLMFDIDNFKEINDSYGHDEGDRTLKILSSIVNKRKRDQDCFARWGGDEFMMLLPNTNVKHAYTFAEHLRLKIAISPLLKAKNVTCSFGITELVNNLSVQELCIRADKALYQAKEHGKNCVNSYTGT